MTVGLGRLWPTQPAVDSGRKPAGSVQSFGDTGAPDGCTSEVRSYGDDHFGQKDHLGQKVLWTGGALCPMLEMGESSEGELAGEEGSMTCWECS